MDIRENISATLKREKEKRGLTFMEFATDLWKFHLSIPT